MCIVSLFQYKTYFAFYLFDICCWHHSLSHKLGQPWLGIVYPVTVCVFSGKYLCSFNTSRVTHILNTFIKMLQAGVQILCVIKLFWVFLNFEICYPFISQRHCILFFYNYSIPNETLLTVYIYFLLFFLLLRTFYSLQKNRYFLTRHHSPVSMFFSIHLKYPPSGGNVPLERDPPLWGNVPLERDPSSGGNVPIERDLLSGGRSPLRGIPHQGGRSPLRGFTFL